MGDEILDFLNWIMDKSAGPFLGVIVAFGLNYLLEWHRRRIAGQDYLRGFRREVNENIASLKRRKLERLRSDQWSAAVNSGDLKLFRSSQRADLSDAYFGVANFMYEAIRTRDMAEKFRSEPEEVQRVVGKAWAGLTEHAYQMGDSLLGTLEQLANKKWFKDT